MGPFYMFVQMEVDKQIFVFENFISMTKLAKILSFE